MHQEPLPTGKLYLINAPILINAQFEKFSY